MDEPGEDAPVGRFDRLRDPALLDGAVRIEDIGEEGLGGLDLYVVQ